MRDKDVNKSLVIKDIVQSNMQYIINGQPQQMESTCICCPECNKPILNFNRKIDFVDVQRYIDENYESLSNEIHYCVNCGQKIHFNKSIDI